MPLAEYGDAFDIDTDAEGDPILVDPQTDATMFRWDRSEGAFLPATIGTPADPVPGTSHFDSVSTERATIGRETRQSFDTHFEPTVVTDDGNYASEPALVQTANSDILIIYRTGDSHVDTTGKLVYKRYSSGSWGSEQTIVDDPSYDDRNHSVGVDESSGRIIVFYRTSDGSSNTIDTYYVTSDDNGQTWSSRTSVASTLSLSNGVPFGDIIRTSNGLMTAFYSSSTTNAEVLFSTDGGQSWGSGVTISSNTDEYEEPTPCRIDEDRIIVYGRSDVGYWYVTSSDGGSTWGTPASVTTDFDNIPVYARQTAGGSVFTILGDRDREQIETYSVAPDALWDDPESLLTGRRSIIANGEGDGGIHFGYPKVTRVEGVTTAVWYDGTSTDTDIYIASLPDSAGGSEVQPPTEVTADRTGGTIYQNTSNSAILVMPTYFNSGAGSVASVEGYINETDAISSTDIVIRDAVTAHDSQNVFASLTMIVPEGYYYRVSTQGSRSNWWEQKL